MPGSWEILSQRDRRVLVTILVPPDLGITLDYAKCMRALQLPIGSDFMEIKGLPWDAARNQAAKTALQQGYNLACWDSDLRIPPDTFLKLLDTGLEIVSGLYYQRQFPFFPCFFNEGKNEKNEDIKVPVQFTPGQLVPCTFLPSGMTLYKRKLLAAMLERFPLPFFYGASNIGPVPDVGGGAALPFSEDFTFSYRAKSLGFTPHCHTGIVGYHEVRAIVGPKWLPPDPYAFCGVCTVP